MSKDTTSKNTMSKKMGYILIAISIILGIALAISMSYNSITQNALETANQKLSELSFVEGETRALSDDKTGYIGIVTVSSEKWIYSTSPDITYQHTPSGNMLRVIFSELTESKIVFASEGDMVKLKYNAVSQCNGHTFYQIITGNNTYYICKV